jgi:hypothetical protein
MLEDAAAAARDLGVPVANRIINCLGGVRSNGDRSVSNNALGSHTGGYSPRQPCDYSHALLIATERIWRFAG